MSAQPPSQPPPGWYPDPSDPAAQRYWDGTAWSSATRPPPPEAPSSAPPAAAQAAATALGVPTSDPAYAAFGAPPPPPPAGIAPPLAPPPGYGPPAPGYPQPVGYPQPGYAQPGPATFGSYVLASWGSRVGASLLDGLILVVLFGIPYGVGLAAKVPAVGLLLGYALVYFAYYPLTMKRPGEHNGQTLGKQALGIRVIREAGEPFSYGTALLREFVIRVLLFGLVGSLTFGIAALLDALWPLWDAGNQALHDKLASTRVVRA